MTGKVPNISQYLYIVTLLCFIINDFPPLFTILFYFINRNKGAEHYFAAPDDYMMDELLKILDFHLLEI